MPRPRILVTRSPRQSSALADRLRELGAEPVLIPTIEIVDPHSFAPLDAALAELPTFDWLLFTSANAVEAFASRRAQLRVDQQKSSVFPRIAAIGQATARALAQIGLAADLLPPQAVAESFAQSLLPHARRRDGRPARFLLVRADEAREHLPEALRAAGAEVTVASAYRTVIPTAFLGRMRDLFSRFEPTGAEAIAAVTFTSSSTVRNLFTMLEAAGSTLPPHVVRASIGPITSGTLRELGFPPHVQSPEATVESLATSLVEYLGAQEGR